MELERACTVRVGASNETLTSLETWVVEITVEKVEAKNTLKTKRTVGTVRGSHLENVKRVVRPKLDAKPAAPNQKGITDKTMRLVVLPMDRIPAGLGTSFGANISVRYLGKTEGTIAFNEIWVENDGFRLHCIHIICKQFLVRLGSPRGKCMMCHVKYIFGGETKVLISSAAQPG